MHNHNNPAHRCHACMYEYGAIVHRSYVHAYMLARQIYFTLTYCPYFLFRLCVGPFRPSILFLWWRCTHTQKTKQNTFAFCTLPASMVWYMKFENLEIKTKSRRPNRARDRSFVNTFWWIFVHSPAHTANTL